MGTSFAFFAIRLVFLILIFKKNLNYFRIINISYTSTGSSYDGNEIFAITFCFIIGGSLIVAFNAKFVGGNM